MIKPVTLGKVTSGFVKIFTLYVNFSPLFPDFNKWPIIKGRFRPSGKGGKAILMKVPTASIRKTTVPALDLQRAV